SGNSARISLSTTMPRCHCQPPTAASIATPISHSRKRRYSVTEQLVQNGGVLRHAGGEYHLLEIHHAGVAVGIQQPHLLHHRAALQFDAADHPAQRSLAWSQLQGPVVRF